MTVSRIALSFGVADPVTEVRSLIQVLEVHANEASEMKAFGRVTPEVSQRCSTAVNVRHDKCGGRSHAQAASDMRLAVDRGGFVSLQSYLCSSSLPVDHLSCLYG
jgi:hypothetical protein